MSRAALFALATSERFERTVKALPGGGPAASRAAGRGRAGRTRDEPLAAAAGLLAAGHGVCVDLFVEMATDGGTADRVGDESLSLAAALPAPPADAWLGV